MEPTGTVIALHLVSDFIHDTIKFASKGEETSPVTEAIESTERYFEGIEGLGESLRQWLRNPSVAEILKTYVEGQASHSELHIPALVSTLVNNTQFYLGDNSASTASEIVEVFLGKIRAAYLTKSPIATLHIANRQEIGFDAIQRQIQHLTGAVETAGGLKTSLQTHFDEATAKVEAEDFPAARALFESLLVEIERAPVQDHNLERRVHVNLANVAARFFEEASAVKHYRIAAELDDDRKRAALNSAVADLIEQKPQEALDRLEAVHDGESSPIAYEYSSAKVGALLRLRRYDEAIELARSIHVVGKEGRRFELLGLAYRESGRLDDAEQAYRESIALEPSRPEVQHALADTLLVPAIEYRNQHPGMALPTSLKPRIDNAANLLESAAARFRTQGRRRAGFEVDSALAVVRALQERFSDVIRLLEPVVESGAASANDWRTLGFAYVNTNELENAAAALKSAITKQPDPETEFLYVETLLMSGKPDDALGFASERAAVPVSQSNVRWHMVKSRALKAKRQFSQAREVISLAQKQFPDDADVLLTSAELYEDTAQYGEATNAFEEALKNATGAVEMQVRHAFGGSVARRKDFARAAELWRPLIRSDKPNGLLDNYVRAAYNSRKFAEITSIAKDIRNSGAKASIVFADVAAAAYEKLDALVEAGYWLEYLGNHYGNRPEHIVRLSNIKLRLGERDQSIELLNASRATLTDPKDIMRFAQAYSILGRHQDFQQLLISGNGFLVEPVTLFTFSRLGLLDKLTKLGHVYIAQRSLDQLHELQARRRTADRQTGVMGMIDGELFMQEITPGEAARMNSALNVATQWAEKQAKVVGLTESLSKDDKKWARVLGVPGLVTMITAQQRGFALVTDDKTFGDIAKQNYGVPFVNTQAVLVRLLALGAISQHEYDSAVLKLFEAGYTLTHVSDGHLFAIISEEQFQLTDRVKRSLRAFEPVTISLIPACAAVAGLLHRIYLEPIPDQIREQLAFYMLDTLATNHPKIQVKGLVRELVRQQANAILVLQLAKIEKMLSRW